MKRNRMEDLQLPEGFRKLIRRLRRGVIIFHSLSLFFVACFGVAIIFREISWAITAFLLSLACRLTFILHVGPRYISAWKVAENPQIVYWGHAAGYQGQAADLNVEESNKLNLHLKDGKQLEVEA